MIRCHHSLCKAFLLALSLFMYASPFQNVPRLLCSYPHTPFATRAAVHPWDAVGACCASRGATTFTATRCTSDTKNLPPRNQHVWNFSHSAPDTLAATLALLPGFAPLYSSTFDLTMYVAGRPATCAAPLLFSLFVTNSALPTTSPVSGPPTEFPINATLSLNNETSLHLPNGIPWSPETSPSQASVPYPIPDTAMTLEFTHFGARIPVVRALSTIYDARQQILSHLASNTEDATRNHIFGYSTRSATPTPHVCSVVLQASGSLGLSWLQLDQILEGLTQFSSGAGTDHRVHYQTLEFQVNLADEGRIGTGLLWSTPGRGRGAAEIQKRAEPPLAGQALDERVNLASGLANETSPNPSDAGNPPSSAAANVSFFPVHGTDINLEFVWFGDPIPSKKVNEALNGAFLKIAPFLEKSGSEWIPKDEFFYWTPAGKIRVSIRIYGMGKMSWSQVDSVVVGLFRFTHGIGTESEEEHFGNLDFDVRDEEGAKIGYGNLLALPFYDGDVIGASDGKRSSPTSGGRGVEMGSAVI